MNFIKIVLKPDDVLGNILKVFREVKEWKVVFICSRGFMGFSDIAFLKKLKKTAEENEKRCVIIVEQKFIYDLLKSQKFDVHLKLPKEFEKGATKTLENFKEKPPVLEDKKEKPKEEKTDKTKEVPNFSSRKIEEKEEDKTFRGKAFFIFLGVVLVLMGVLFWISPSCTITIKPKISVIPITQNILLTLPDSKVRKEDENLPRVGGIYIETSVQENETFLTSGRRYDLTNSKGYVTIYNETAKPKKLVPSRLSTEDGMIFRFKENITVPPREGNYAGEKVVAIEADAYDEEDKPIGERGNITAGTELFFPALRSQLQELYYAKANKGPLVGGSTLIHYSMTEDDIPRTRNYLIETFRSQAIQKLKKEIEDRSLREKKRYVLLDDLRMFKTQLENEKFPEHLVGANIETFDISATLKLKGIVFDQTQVTQFMDKKIRETQDNRKKLITIDPYSAEYKVFEISSELESNENEEEEEEMETTENDLDNLSRETGKNWIKLAVQMEGAETIDFDSDDLSSQEWRHNLKKEIAGKTVQEARSILGNYSEIETVLDIKIAPFWSKKLPTIFNQIDFEIF